LIEASSTFAKTSSLYGLTRSTDLPSSPFTHSPLIKLLFKFKYLFIIYASIFKMFFNICLFKNLYLLIILYFTIFKKFLKNNYIILNKILLKKFSLKKKFKYTTLKKYIKIKSFIVRVNVSQVHSYV